MPRPKKSPSPLADPLFAAMIAKLPPSDKAWDVDKQVAWLNMMAMAFGTVYGGNAAERLACKCHDTLPAPVVQHSAIVGQPPALPQKFQRNGATNGAAEPVPESTPAAKPIPHPFYIDKEGYARNKKGDRIMPSDVPDMIADMRGEEGDLAAIVWADGSTGARSLNATITLG